MASAVAPGGERSLAGKEEQQRTALALAAAESAAQPAATRQGAATVSAALSAGELLELCEAVLVSFNPSRMTLDAHSVAFLGARKGLAGSDRMFCHQVLYGCVRYKAALKALLTSFYYTNSASLSRQDYTKYLVLSYLCLFRLEELGWPALQRLVESQAAEKMVVFLRFCFSPEQLECWVKDEWIKSYDLAWVETHVIGVVSKYARRCSSLVASLSALAFGRGGGGGGGGNQSPGSAGPGAGSPAMASSASLASSTSSALAEGKLAAYVKPPTVPQPFNITPARPTRVPEPLRIKQEIVARAVPAWLGKRSLEQIAAERAASKHEVHAATLAKYHSGHEFKLHETRDTLTRLVEERDRQLELQAGRRFVAKAPPDFGATPAPVRMNAAAVLREDALYKRKQALEAQLVESYEEDLRDSTEFAQWQAARRAEDEEQRLRLVEQRRVAAEQSQEEAREASAAQLRRNQHNAQQLRAEVEVRAALKEQQTGAVVEAKQALAGRVKAVRGEPERRRQVVRGKNRAAAAQLRQQQRREEQACEEERRVEQERRNDLIRRIRALERVPAARVAGIFDPSQSAGHGLLEEMSLVELHERLVINEAKETARLEELRERALRDKQAQAEAMQQRIASIQRARRAAAEANVRARAEHTQQVLDTKARKLQLQEEAKAELAERLRDVRAQRVSEIDKLQAEEQERAKRNSFLGAATEIVEEKVHEEWLKGHERTYRDAQGRAQLETLKQTQIKHKELLLRESNAQAAAKEALARDEERHKKLVLADKAKKQKDFALIKEKRELVRDEQKRYEHHVAALRTINPYATSVASGVPLQVIQAMSRQQLATFFTSKPLDLDKTLDALCPNRANRHSASASDSIDALFQALQKQQQQLQH